MTGSDGRSNAVKPRSFISDPTDTIIQALGIGLLIAFIFPIIGAGYRGSIRFMFLNIEGLGERIGFLFKIELIYPLIAGIILLILARQVRSAGRATALLVIGILPFLLLFLSKETRRGLEGVMQAFGGGLGIAAILGALGVFCILAGAHASRVKPGVDLASYVASAGAGLWLLQLFIPVRGQLSLILPFKMIGRGGHWIAVVAGIIALVAMVVMIIAAVHCFLMINQKENRKEYGTRVIQLYIGQLLLWGLYLLLLIIYTAVEARRGGGAAVLAILSLIIKLVPWIFGLFFVIPLGIGDFLILSPEKK